MNENSYMEECIRLMEEKLNRGSSGQWTAYHFSLLSQEIYNKTGKTVSDSTLKRLFGKKDTSENYTPQLYTRNAIAEYLGYADWQNLIIHLKKPEVRLPGTKQKKNYPAVYILTGISIVLVLAMILIFSVDPEKESKGWIKTSDTLRIAPFTAIFQYDISGIDDSVFIDFGNNLPVPLPREKHSITEFYKSCGVFYPKIFTRKKVLDSLRLLSMSSGWQGGYSPNDDYRMFIPFEDTSVFSQKGKLYITPEHLKFQDPLYHKGIYAEYRLMQNFNVSLDSIKFLARIKNSPQEGGKLCYDAEVWLIGSEESCRVRFVEPGCFRYGQFKIGEKEYNGRFDNLSALAKDVKNWADMEVITRGSEVEVFYNGKTVLREKYRKQLAKFLGTYIRFYGTGSVQHVKIENNSGIVYKSNF